MIRPLAIAALLALPLAARGAEPTPVYVLTWTVPASGSECECNTCQDGLCTLMYCPDPCKATRTRHYEKLEDAVATANQLAMTCETVMVGDCIITWGTTEEPNSDDCHAEERCTLSAADDFKIVRRVDHEVQLEKIEDAEQVEVRQVKRVRYEVKP